MIMNMTKFVITATFEGSKSRRQMQSIIENMCADMGINISKLNIRVAKKPGRPPAKSEKLEAWLKGRHKPFGTMTFAAYMGVTRATAYKRLQGLVRAGVMTKEYSEAEGMHLYQVKRPD